jgi:hypothetical protein
MRIASPICGLIEGAARQSEDVPQPCGSLRARYSQFQLIAAARIKAQERGEAARRHPGGVSGEVAGFEDSIVSTDLVDQPGSGTGM